MKLKLQDMPLGDLIELHGQIKVELRRRTEAGTMHPHPPEFRTVRNIDAARYTIARPHMVGEADVRRPDGNGAWWMRVIRDRRGWDVTDTGLERDGQDPVFDGDGKLAGWVSPDIAATLAEAEEEKSRGHPKCQWCGSAEGVATWSGWCTEDVMLCDECQWTANMEE